MQRAITGGADEMHGLVHPGVAFCRCADSASTGAGVPRQRPRLSLGQPDPHLRIVRRNMAIIFGLATILWAGIVFLVLLAFF